MILFALLAACGTASDPVCTDDATALAGDLTCADGKAPARYVRILAGRPLAPGSLATSVDAVRAAHEKDPEATARWITSIAREARAIEAATGLEAAERRSAALYRMLRDRGPVGKQHAAIWNLQDSTLSVWATDDREELALTETDIEGWIQFASLAHEVRGKGPITLSIANKADIYRMTAERFSQGDRAEKIALTSLGVVWPEVVKRWKAAPYAKQQRLIQAAAWPDIGEASSLAFVEAVIEGDLVTNAAAVHAVLGPLHFRDGDGYFGGAP
jgi:hypothetical protein